MEPDPRPQFRKQLEDPDKERWLEVRVASWDGHSGGHGDCLSVRHHVRTEDGGFDPSRQAKSRSNSWVRWSTSSVTTSRTDDRRRRGLNRARRGLGELRPAVTSNTLGSGRHRTCE